jgi:hypothetical protein
VKHWAENIKPAAAVHVHLFTAWLMWSVVGVLLVTLGSWWVWQEPTTATPWLTAAAIGIGVLKSRYVLDRAAHRIVARIRTRGDGRCLGGFLSLRSWALVVLMVALGRLVRGAPVAASILGLLYIAVGTALVLSSRISWWARRETRE